MVGDELKLTLHEAGFKVGSDLLMEFLDDHVSVGGRRPGIAKPGGTRGEGGGEMN